MSQSLRGAKSMEFIEAEWDTGVAADGKKPLDGDPLRSHLDHHPNHNHLPRKGDSWKAIEKEEKVIV